MAAAASPRAMAAQVLLSLRSQPASSSSSLSQAVVLLLCAGPLLLVLLLLWHVVPPFPGSRGLRAWGRFTRANGNQPSLQFLPFEPIVRASKSRTPSNSAIDDSPY
jgi:hypothetical protein